MHHNAASMFQKTAGTILGILIAVALPACSRGESNVEAGNRDGILHYGNGAEPQSLDPHVISGSPEVTITSTLFEGLVTTNPYSLEIEPGVAQRWEFSDDRRVITFYLNPRARWSNGDPVTAEDFVWSFERALTPALGNPLAYTLFPIVNAQEYADGTITDPDAIGVKALDERTFEVTLNNPTPYFLSILAGYTAFPVHRPTLEAHGRVTDRFTPWTRPGNMVNNGPFTLQEWKMNRRLTVVKSETYWDAENVKLNAVVFHPTENEISEERMFRVGQLHYTDRVPLNKIPTYRTMKNSPYRQAPLLGSYYLLFNILQPPGNDARVRQALAQAIDRDTLVATILQGSESPGVALTPPGIPGYQPPDIIEYDLRPRESCWLRPAIPTPGLAGAGIHLQLQRQQPPDRRGRTTNVEGRSQHRRDSGQPGVEGLPRYLKRREFPGDPRGLDRGLSGPRDFSGEIYYRRRHQPRRLLRRAL